MILIFTNDDSTVMAVDDISEMQTFCEKQDIEEGLYTFVNESGTVLQIVHDPPPKDPILRWLGHGSFKLQPSEERRPDLLEAVVNGEIHVQPGPRITSRGDLIEKLKI